MHGNPAEEERKMRTYIELRDSSGSVRDWRVIIDDDAATIEAIAEKVRELTWNGISAGDTIAVYESDQTAEQLKLPR
jgi:hypothetical protein